MLSSVTEAARAASLGSTNDPGWRRECVRLPSANFTHPSHASRRRPFLPMCSIARSASASASTSSRSESDFESMSWGRNERSLTVRSRGRAEKGESEGRAGNSEPKTASRKGRAENSVKTTSLSGRAGRARYSDSLTSFSARRFRPVLLDSPFSACSFRLASSSVPPLCSSSSSSRSRKFR